MADQTFRVDRAGARILGVCAGLARTTGVDVTLIRIAAALGTVMSFGVVGVAAYLIAGWMGQGPRP